MPGPIKPKTNFDRAADSLQADSGRLLDKADAQLEKAVAALEKAGVARKDAFDALKAAGSQLALAGDQAADGGSHAIDALGHALAGLGYTAAGVGGWALEGVAEGVRFVAKNLAKGFAHIANFLAGKDGPKVTVVEVEGDPEFKRLSERMFDKASGRFRHAGDDLKLAWNAWAEAVGHAAASGRSIADAASHVAGAAAGLIEAARLYGLAALDTLAAAGAELAAAAVRAAGAGVEGARDLAILSAKFSAKVANLMANPGDGTLEVAVQQQLGSYARELKALVAKKPELTASVAEVSFAS